VDTGFRKRACSTNNLKPDDEVIWLQERPAAIKPDLRFVFLLV